MRQTLDITALQAPFYAAMRGHGAFLNVGGESPNTMTIGWGSLGFLWGKPIATVMVRHSRHTYKLLEQAGAFTISIPAPGALVQALAYCGSHSGREGDKFAAAGLSTAPARSVDAPVVAGCAWQVECRVVYEQSMEPALLDTQLGDTWYREPDYHTFYYGEITAIYQTK
nr:flavin reductase family protein [Maliibacterium massiliense]